MNAKEATDKVRELQYFCDKVSESHTLEDIKTYGSAFVFTLRQFLKDLSAAIEVKTGNENWFRVMLIMNPNINILNLNNGPFYVHKYPNFGMPQSRSHFTKFIMFCMGYILRQNKKTVRSKKAKMPEANPPLIQLVESYDGMPNMQTFSIQCQACVNELDSAVKNAIIRCFLSEDKSREYSNSKTQKHEQEKSYD